MAKIQDITNRIETTRVVAVMRGAFVPDVAVTVAGILLEEGFSVFELTTNSDQPIEAMKAVKLAYGDSAFVGMGTVLDVETAKKVMDAGADFVVSPAFDPAVVKTVVDANVMMTPGVITPSEAVAAWAMGVPILKLFPIGTLGVPYFKAVFGPLNHMKFMCNGGTDQNNARAFIDAGAVGLGIAGWLTGDGHTPLETIRSRAQSLQASLKIEK